MYCLLESVESEDFTHVIMQYKYYKTHTSWCFQLQVDRVSYATFEKQNS